MFDGYRQVNLRASVVERLLKVKEENKLPSLNAAVNLVCDKAGVLWMSLYGFVGKELYAIDIQSRKASGLEVLWQELKWDSFFETMEGRLV